MKFLHGSSKVDFLMIHGGAGPMDPSKEGIQEATGKILSIAKAALVQSQDKGSLEMATEILEGLEDDESFNAGFGAALQADGAARLSASLMEGQTLKFSGVISVSDVQHPSRLALHLQNKKARVLTGPGPIVLARRLNMPVADLVSEKRFQRWLGHRQDAKSQPKGYDTVGVVMSSQKHGLISGTSTGGTGYEEPGRVSDSATVAGNYASTFAAISMTGVGEEIVDFGVAVRIETRVRDGLSLKDACQKTFDEALALGHEYGWIACDGQGNWCVAYTTENMTFLVQTLSGETLAQS